MSKKPAEMAYINIG